MNDRLVNGLIAGFIGGAVAKAWSLFSFYVLHFATLPMLDWIDAIFIGHIHRNTGEWVVGFVGVLFWHMGLGVGMSFLFQLIGVRAYLVKGLFYASAVQYAIYGATGLFRLHDIVPLDWQTLTSDFVVAIVFGLVTAYVLKRLDHPRVSE